MAVEPYDEAINSTLDKLQKDPDLAFDGFRVTLTTLLEVVSQGHYPQNSASLKSLLNDFIRLNSIQWFNTPINGDIVDTDAFVKKLKLVMESAVQNSCLPRVIQGYIAGEKVFEEIEEGIRSGNSLKKYAYRGLEQHFHQDLASEYSTSEAMQNDLNNGNFIKKIKSLEVTVNPLFLKLNDYLLDYTTEKPTAVIDDQLLFLHKPRGSSFQFSVGAPCIIDYLEQHQGIKLGSYINHEDIYGDNLLHKAAKAERKELVARLLEAGADPTKPNHHGCEPSALTHNSEIKEQLCTATAKRLTQAVSSSLAADPLAPGIPAMTPETILAADRPLLSNSAA